ncbi:MAG: hypothetical protein ACOYOU_04620 [Kiritimatiellia bacterium]
MSNPTALVQKLWHYCIILRDDDLSYGACVEPLTGLLFLRMAGGLSCPAFVSLRVRRDAAATLPAAEAWAGLAQKGEGC